MNTSESHHILQRFRSDDVNLVELFDNILHCIFFRHENRLFGQDEIDMSECPDNMVGNGLQCLEYGHEREARSLEYHPVWFQPLSQQYENMHMVKTCNIGNFRMRRYQYFTRMVNMMQCSGHILLEHEEEQILQQRGNTWEEEQNAWMHGFKMHQDGLAAQTNTVCILNENENMSISNLTSTLHDCIDHSQCLCCPRMVVGNPTSLVLHLEEKQEFEKIHVIPSVAWPQKQGLYTRKMPQVYGMRVCMDLVDENTSRQCVEQWDILFTCPDISGVALSEYFQSSREQQNSELDAIQPSQHSMVGDPIVENEDSCLLHIRTSLEDKLARFKLHTALANFLATDKDHITNDKQTTGIDNTHTLSLTQLYQRVLCLSGKHTHIGRGKYMARVEPLLTCHVDTSPKLPVLAEYVCNMPVMEEQQYLNHHAHYPSSIHASHVIWSKPVSCQFVVQYSAMTTFPCIVPKLLDDVQITRIRNWGMYFMKLIHAKHLTCSLLEQYIQWYITGLDISLQKLSHFLYSGVYDTPMDVLIDQYGQELAFLLVITSKGDIAMEECLAYVQLQKQKLGISEPNTPQQQSTTNSRSEYQNEDQTDEMEPSLLQDQKPVPSSTTYQITTNTKNNKDFYIEDDENSDDLDLATYTSTSTHSNTYHMSSSKQHILHGEDDEQEAFVPQPLLHLSNIPSTPPHVLDIENTSGHTNRNVAIHLEPTTEENTLDSPFSTSVGGVEPALPLLAMIRMYPLHTRSNISTSLDFQIPDE